MMMERNNYSFLLFFSTLFIITIIIGSNRLQVQAESEKTIVIEDRENPIDEYDELEIFKLPNNTFKISFCNNKNEKGVRKYKYIISCTLNDSIIHETTENIVVMESDMPGKPSNNFSIKRGIEFYEKQIAHTNQQFLLSSNEYRIQKEDGQQVQLSGNIRLTASRNEDGTWNLFGIIIPTHNDSSESIDFITVDFKQGKWVKLKNEKEDGVSINCGTDGGFVDGKQQKSSKISATQALDMTMMAAMSNGSRSPFTEGCPLERRVAYIGVVADCSYVSKFRHMEECKNEILTQWAIASAIFERTFNISLCILTLTILKDCSTPTSKTPFNRECLPSYSISKRLSDFSNWRGSQDKRAMVYHLMTGCPTDNMHGLAWINQACEHVTRLDPKENWVNGTSLSVKISYQFSVISHELGHNLGAAHDCAKAQCSVPHAIQTKCVPCLDQCDCKGKYIMSPDGAGNNLKQFSPNSIKTICGLMPMKQECLFAPGTLKTAIGPVCGNGIKEPGEECDCGDAESCAKDPCCGTDCKLKPGARCSDFNDACCRNCKVIPKRENKVCNIGDGICAFDSICDGISPDCPSLPLLKNGASCKSQNVLETDSQSPACASGFCTSKDMQCRAFNSTVFGEFLKACSGRATSCKMYCERVDDGKCYLFNNFFIDGTKCGKTGFCLNGECVGASATDYMSDNWEFLFLLLFVILAVLLIIIVWCIKHAAKKREERERRERELRQIQPVMESELRDETDEYHMFPRIIS